MSRIVHLEDNLEKRLLLRDILSQDGHEVIGASSIVEARDVAGQVDLYLCAQLGKYSDGLSFATEMLELGRKVIILSDRRKFHKIPFISYGSLFSPEVVLKKVREALAGVTT